MKRTVALLLVMLMLCSLTACRQSGESTTSTQTEPPISIPTDPNRDPTGGGQLKPNEIALGQQGRIKGTYTMNISSVRYITSVEQLPNYDGLERFDEDYFREKALLVVVETVTSGSIGVAIASVTIDGSDALVKLEHKSGAEAGTADMTVWLLWAEVDKDLQYRWRVTNPAVKSDASEY